ncbi:hypothetical protein ACHQM5_008748 [Ranunculus cassubicifolius]
MEGNFRELQLLPSHSSNHLSAWNSGTSENPYHPPSINLQLSISLQPSQSPSDYYLANVKSLKWEAEQQIRLATAEKTYADQVREMARREMELAQSELVRARMIWEQAKQEMEKVDRMKEIASRKIDSKHMEITCQTCWQRFSP